VRRRRRAGIFHWRRHQQNLFSLLPSTDNPRPDSTFVPCTYNQRKAERKRDIIYIKKNLSLKALWPQIEFWPGKTRGDGAASFHVKNALLLWGFERFSISIFCHVCI